MKYKVLIIEDSPTSMRILKRVVSKANLTAVCAESLTEAKHIFSNSTPESFLCALIDYTLPDAPDGEAIDFAIESFIPAVVITGRLDEAVRANVLSKAVVPKENAQVYEYLSRLLGRLEKNKSVGVLVVDDSRVSRNKMVSLLRRHNFVTYDASGAIAGIEILHANKDIKLIITDENMPDMTGVEMVAEVRRIYDKDELSIIGVSSDTSSALSARFIKSGATDYLMKPYCHEEFFCRVLQNVELVEHIEAIRRAANSDYLTGLPNRRHFFGRANSLLKRDPAKVSLALIDLDLFKNVNDTYGHDCGDYVLKEVAKTIVKHFSKYCVARFGGEEFCIFFADIDSDEAYKMLENFRREISEKVLTFGQHQFSFSLSIGLTGIFKGTIEAMLTQADENLYKAKENGRNQVMHL
jgi:diguanylate cyclase (GGDEF)-like protein